MAAVAISPAPKKAIPSTTTLTINLVKIDRTITPFEISSDTTFAGLIDKVIELTQTKFHVGICWEGREIAGSVLGPRKTANANNQFNIRWHTLRGSEIELSDPIPIMIQQLTGVKEADKCIKVSNDLFAKLKITQVCDIKHNNLFGVLIYIHSGLRSSAKVSSRGSFRKSISYQSSLCRIPKG